MVKARVPGPVSKSVFLCSQTGCILILKGLPETGREGKAVRKRRLAEVLKIASILFTPLFGLISTFPFDIKHSKERESC